MVVGSSQFYMLVVCSSIALEIVVRAYSVVSVSESILRRISNHPFSSMAIWLREMCHVCHIRGCLPMQTTKTKSWIFKEWRQTLPKPNSICFSANGELFCCCCSLSCRDAAHNKYFEYVTCSYVRAIGRLVSYIYGGRAIQHQRDLTPICHRTTFVPISNVLRQIKY